MHAKEHILLVDDEPQVLVALEDLLCEQFTVLTAPSADRALDALSRDRDIAVVVTDQRMPHMTGDELVAEVKKTSGTPSILLTGFADLSAVIRAVNEGQIFAYVTKPWDASDLCTKVATASKYFRLSRTLAHERRLLADLMDSTPDGVYIKDADLRFQRVNAAFARCVGVADADRMIGMRLADADVDDETCARLEAEERVVLEQGRASPEMLRRLTLGGQTRWFSAIKAPIRDPAGRIVGVVGISRDVSERVAVNEALAASEARFREQTRLLNLILASMGEGVIAISQDDRTLVTNRRAVDLLGVDTNEVPPARWPETVGMFDAHDHKRLVVPEENVIVRAMTQGETVQAEVFVKNAAVKGATLALTASALQDEDGRRSGGILVLRDVTDERRLEQQLAQSQKMEAIGVLAGGIAHDFNNLLSVIVTCGDVVLAGIAEGDPNREYLSEMLEASRRGSTLTRQLLAFSRKQVYEPKILSLNAIVADSEKMLRRILGEDVLLETKLGSSPGRITGDAGQIDQIILNLAVNARDAMPDGGVLTIETGNVTLGDDYCRTHAGVSPGCYAMLAVTDAGCGMDAETQRRIFEPFFTTKRAGQGTGLGLSTVYGIVSQHGGHIDVYSEPGVGTAFKVYFPFAAGTIDTRRRRAPDPIPAAGGTVLLVEDDEAVRRVAGKVLARAGYTVLEARSAGAARDICRARGGAVDLLLTDVVMPDTNGPKLAAELRGACPRMRTLFMSGYPGGAATRNTCLPAGVPFLPKPFTAASLLEKVHEVLSVEDG